MTDLVGHFLIFTLVAIAALMAPLLLGALLRPRLPTPEKDAVYECGEPTIGSSYIQFDLRFYVVALLFIIFDVELVFFFPWVLAFGGATQLADTRLTEPQRVALTERYLSVEPGSLNAANSISAETALQLSWIGFLDVLFFFGILIVGFAYVWKRGDLDWVRALTKKSQHRLRPSRAAPKTAPVVNPVVISS